MNKYDKSLPPCFVHAEGPKDTKPEEVFGSYIPTGNPIEYWQQTMKALGKAETFPSKSL